MITADQIIDSGFPDNNTQDITAAVLRTTLKAMLIAGEFIHRTTLSLPNNPSVSQIEAGLIDAGNTLPLISDRVLYLHTGNGKMFNIAYNKDTDEYFFERLAKATV